MPFAAPAYDPSVPVADLLVLGFLAGVLCLSGVTKVDAREETQDALVSLRVPVWVSRRLVAAALPWAEIVLAGGLLVAPAPLLVAVAGATTALMTAYTLLIARALRFAEPVTCSCFGRLGRHRVDRLTLVRNLLLTALAVGAVVVAARGGSVPAAVASMDAGDWWTVIVAGIVIAAAVLVAAGGREQPEAYGGDELDYLRAPIPFARLDRPDGRSETLRELASTRARLLVLLNPTCGSCLRVARRVDDWAERLAPSVDVLTVYSTRLAPDQHLEHARDRVALDPDANVRTVFAISASPAAVLLGADGLLAGGPVIGKDAIVQLVDDVLGELETADRHADS